MICPNCRVEIQDGANFCAQCGLQIAKRRGGARTFFKWSAIGCGGLIGLFVIIVILAAIFGSSDEDLPPRTAAASPTPEATHTPVPTPTPVPTFAELKSEAAVVPYDDLFRYNERYVGESVYYRGQVVQVVGLVDEFYAIRVNVTREQVGFWTDDVLITYERGDGVRVLEEDIIEFVGIVSGLHQYEAVLGNQRTIPALIVAPGRLVVEGADITSQPGAAAIPAKSSPATESADALACEWSIACAASGLDHELWARVFQECEPNLACRLQASADEISENLASLASVESRQGADGATVYRATTDDGQRSVTWMDKNGVVFMDMSATVPYDVNNIATEVLLRNAVSEAVPAPWEFDVAAGIASFWSVFYTQPASVWSDGPDAEVSYGSGGDVNGVAMRVYYVPRLSKAGVVFVVSP